MKKKPVKRGKESPTEYGFILEDIARIIEAARQSTVKSVNTVMTTAYWLVGRRIIESEQDGAIRAKYGLALLQRLSENLTRRFGRGFSVDNLESMRAFYLAYPPERISETVSRISTVENENTHKSETLSRILDPKELSGVFPLSWSHYVVLVKRSRSQEARIFYQTEALRGGWSVRQLARQIDSQFYERTALSKNKASMLRKGQQTLIEDAVSPEEMIKDPYVLEFLDLKDEYSETDLEEALIQHLEVFLMELGGDFCFIGRQKRLRVGNTWYKMDLVFFHRRLRCLLIIDLKIGEFTHADAGQMYLYLNYAQEHWTHEDENPPVGLILCAQKDEAVAHYALEGLPNKVMASEYRTTLPDEKMLAAEIELTRAILERRKEVVLPYKKKRESEKSKKTK